MSGNKEIFEKVKKIIVDHLGVEESKVSESASFVDDLGADSLDQVEITMELEDEFGIEISDKDAEQIYTVRQAVETVKFFFFFAARRDAFYHRVLQEHHLPECMCALELLVHEALSY